MNQNINLEFHKPKKDQCDECETFKNLPKPINEAQEIKQKDHLRNKDAARTQKHIDKLIAINSNDTLTAAFDFQKIHTVPQGKTCIYYYKRKLNILNFTLFDMAKKIAKKIHVICGMKTSPKEDLMRWQVVYMTT